MRIVDFKTFITMPKGTVYCEYSGNVLPTEIHIKDENVSEENRDFFYEDLFAVDAPSPAAVDDILYYAVEKGSTVPLHFETQSRWGLFDEKSMFAVFETAEVESLIARLQKALVDAKPKATSVPPHHIDVFRSFGVDPSDDVWLSDILVNKKVPPGYGVVRRRFEKATQNALPGQWSDFYQRLRAAEEGRNIVCTDQLHQSPATKQWFWIGFSITDQL